MRAGFCPFVINLCGIVRVLPELRADGKRDAPAADIRMAPDVIVHRSDCL